MRDEGAAVTMTSGEWLHPGTQLPLKPRPHSLSMQRCGVISLRQAKNRIISPDKAKNRSPHIFLGATTEIQRVKEQRNQFYSSLHGWLPSKKSRMGATRPPPGRVFPEVLAEGAPGGWGA